MSFDNVMSLLLLFAILLAVIGWPVAAVLAVLVILTEEDP